MDPMLILEQGKFIIFFKKKNGEGKKGVIFGFLLYMYRKGDKVGHRIGPTPLALSSRVQKHWKAQIERSSLCIELFPDSYCQPGPTNRLSDLLNYFFSSIFLHFQKKKKNFFMLYNQYTTSIILLHFPIINVIKKKENLWFLAFISSSLLSIRQCSTVFLITFD